MNLAIITARGGSKRIPRKNIRPFCGRPIIAYSIDAARESGCFDEVMVSTDDAEIADVALQHGAQVPFLRSAATSSDHATTADVLIEVMDAYRTAGRLPTLACCLYPTAPFVTAHALRAGRDLLDRQPDLDLKALRHMIGGRYSVSHRIGDGGMATVYYALHSALDRPVVLKVLHPHLSRDADMRERFRREAETAAQLVHPHVCNIIDFGMNVQEAGDAARWRHNGSTDWATPPMRDGGYVQVESGISYATQRALTQRGHDLRAGDDEGGFGGYQAIRWDPVNKVYWGSSESRKDGAAQGW